MSVSALPGTSPISVSISSTIARTWLGRSVGLDIVVGWYDAAASSGSSVMGPSGGGRGSARHGPTRAEPAGRERIERAGLRPAQPRPRVLAERWAVISALLQDHQPPSERRDPPADLVVDGCREREVTDGVEAVRVESERHDDDGTGDVGDRRARAVDGLEIVRVRCPGPEGQIEVLPRPLAFAGL